MTIWLRLTVSLVLLGSGCGSSPPGTRVVSREPASVSLPCAATPLEDRLPDVIAPMAGQDPIWLVDGSAGIWMSGTTPVKSVWVLSRRVNGSLKVEGRQLDGDGVVTFRAGVNSPIRDSLDISDPSSRSMSPNGATAEILRNYAFVASYVLYPNPGCWELRARLGTVERRIVLEVRERFDAA